MQREPRPTSTIMPTEIQHYTIPESRSKSFSEVLRESYWKRNQLHHDRDKAAQKLALQRKLEHQRLFGYVITLDGRTLTTEEALRKIEKGKLTKHEILEWHNPEIYCDEILSVGERDSLDTFPAMNVDRGDVLHDPKIRGYNHPSLKNR